MVLSPLVLPYHTLVNTPKTLALIFILQISHLACLLASVTTKLYIKEHTLTLNLLVVQSNNNHKKISREYSLGSLNVLSFF